MSKIVKKAVKVLLISDIHKCQDYFPKSFLKIIDDHPDIDMIFNCGDLAFSNGSAESRAKQRDNEYNESIQIMKTIDGTNLPHYFVPGNHDLLEHFSEGDQHESTYINMHNRCMEILPELYMIGYGGSIRAYSLNSSNSYKGYPRDEDDFDYDELKALFDKVPKEANFILLLHNPPSEYGIFSLLDWMELGTCLAPKLNQKKGKICNPAYEIMNGGSKVLFQLINDPNYSGRIVAIVHGHMHGGQGMNSIGAKTFSPAVINAGPFSHGRYALLDLIYNDNRWKIKCVTLDRIYL